MRRAMLLLLVTLSLTLCLTSNLAPATPDPLEVWYNGYNVALFNHELPDKIVIDHELHDDRFMAVTDTYADGTFRISFNSKFEPSPKQGRETLLHEMCHIRQSVEGESELDIHGQKWQSCMHKVADEKGFEPLW